MSNILDTYDEQMSQTKNYLQIRREAKELENITEELKEKKEQLEMVNMQMIESEALPTVWNTITKLGEKIQEAENNMNGSLEVYLSSNSEEEIDFRYKIYNKNTKVFTNLIKMYMGILRELGIKDVVAKAKTGVSINNNTANFNSKSSPFKGQVTTPPTKKQTIVEIENINHLK